MRAFYEWNEWLLGKLTHIRRRWMFLRSLLHIYSSVSPNKYAYRWVNTITTPDRCEICASVCLTIMVLPIQATTTWNFIIFTCQWFSTAQRSVMKKFFVHLCAGPWASDSIILQLLLSLFRYSAVTRFTFDYISGHSMIISLSLVFTLLA